MFILFQHLGKYEKMYKNVLQIGKKTEHNEYVEIKVEI